MLRLLRCSISLLLKLESGIFLTFLEHLRLDTRVVVQRIFLPIVGVLLLVALLKECLVLVCA